MQDSNLLFEILLLLALTATGLALFERLKLPAIAGFLVVGAIAGPGVLGLVGEPDRVRVLAEVGIVFLLFEIGLELPLERLRRLWRSALLAGGIQVAATVAVVALGSAVFGLEPASALILGGIVAMSSTALVMRLLVDRGQVDAPHGQLAVAILILQDLSIVPFLLAIPLLAGDAGTSSLDLLLALGRLVLALGVLLGVVRYLVPRLLTRAAQLRSPDLFSLLALLVVLGSAFLAEELGLTLAVGAFLAGVVAGASPHAHQLFSEVVPLRGVFLGIFFTAVGMLFDPAAVIELAPWILAYLAVATLLKAVIVAVISALLMKQGIRVGVLAGLALAQTGEFSFVLAEAAGRAGLLEEWLHQVVISGSILSLLATPFLFRAAPALADFVARGADQLAGEPDLGSFGQLAQVDRGAADATQDRDGERVVVIGIGLGGQTLTRLLRSLGTPYVVIDSNAQGVEDAIARGEPAVFGDATRPPVLRRLGVTRAKLVAVVISDPLATRRIVSRVRELAPHTPILARTRYVLEVDALSELGSTAVVAEEFEGSLELVAQALRLFKLPGGAIRNFTDALREEGYGAIRTPAELPLDPWLLELLRESGQQWVEVPKRFPHGKSLAELDVRARCGANVLAVERAGTTTANPEASMELQAGDRLLVLGDATALEELDALLEGRPPGAVPPG